MSKELTIENAEIAFRNFSGKAGQYNNEGNRNFAVILDHDVADQLIRDGWNVRFLKPHDEHEEDQPYMQVTCRFDNFPPMVYLISNGNMRLLDVDTVSILDTIDIETVDMVLTPYDWTMGSKTGRKAYLKKIYVTMVEDKLARKYSNAPDSAVSCILGPDGNCVDAD